MSRHWRNSSALESLTSPRFVWFLFTLMIMGLVYRQIARSRDVSFYFEPVLFQEPKQSTTFDKTHLVAQVPVDYSQELLFHIQTQNTHQYQYPDCGGCKVLWELQKALTAHGFVASANVDCPDNDLLQRAKQENRTLVVIHGEQPAHSCHVGPNGPHKIEVRWILAPVEYRERDPVFDVWGFDDLVFNYATSTGVNVPVRNVLQVIVNPEPGDVTDITDEAFYSKNRSGIAWMMRKGGQYHSNTWLQHIHNQPGYNSTELQRGLRDPTVLEKFEYFVTYDPYTYWSWFAAMLGTISVVHPMENVSKSEWERGTFVGSYLQYAGDSSHIPGVAYGWNPQEINYARQTMHELRSFLIDVKNWGANVTVPTFARDCYRYRHGERVNFESAMLVHDVYSSKTRDARQLFCEECRYNQEGLGIHNTTCGEQLEDAMKQNRSLPIQEAKARLQELDPNCKNNPYSSFNFKSA